MPQAKYIPERKCIACRTVKPKTELLRVTLLEGELRADPEGRLPGRGCYVCKTSECLKTATTKNCFSKSFRKGFTKDQLSALLKELNANIN